MMTTKKEILTLIHPKTILNKEWMKTNPKLMKMERLQVRMMTKMHLETQKKMIPTKIQKNRKKRISVAYLNTSTKNEQT